MGKSPACAAARRRFWSAVALGFERIGVHRWCLPVSSSCATGFAQAGEMPKSIQRPLRPQGWGAILESRART